MCHLSLGSFIVFCALRIVCEVHLIYQTHTTAPYMSVKIWCGVGC